MKRRCFSLLIILLLIISMLFQLSEWMNWQPLIETVQAVHVYADNGTSIGIQAAIDNCNASGGGTVHIPSGDWNFSAVGGPWTPVTIPSGVNLVGATTTRTSGYDEPTYGMSPNDQVVSWETVLHMPYDAPGTYDNQTNWFILSGDGVSPIRFSDIKLVGYRSINDSSVTWHRAMTITNVPDFRVDHCYFEHTTAGIVVSGANCRGIIDHSYLVNIRINAATIWYEGDVGYGVGIYSGNVWATNTTSDVAGQYTVRTVFIEDCFLEKWRHCIASNNGAHYIARHNTFGAENTGFGDVDAHGAYGPVGTRGIEVYNNDFIDCQIGWNLRPMLQRGGFGAHFENQIRSGSNYTHFCRLENEGSLEYCWPHDVYFWDNVGITTVSSGGPVLDVDYFLDTEMPNYTAYTYPHPLVDAEQRTLLWSDDFESGDLDAWSFVSSGSEVVGTDSGHTPYAGSYMGKFDVDEERCRADFEENQTVWATCYVTWENTPSTGSQQFDIITLGRVAAGYQIRAFLSWNGTDAVWRIRWYNGSLSYTAASLLANPSNETWHKITIFANHTDPPSGNDWQCKMWVNDTLLINVTTSTGQGWDLDFVFIGMRDLTGSNAIFIDEVTVETPPYDIEEPPTTTGTILGMLPDNDNDHKSLRFASQRKIWYGQTRYWIFYANYSVGYLQLRTSVDGVSVTTPTNIIVCNQTFSTWSNGTHVTLITTFSDDQLRWRYGSLETNGSISWLDTSEIITASSGVKLIRPNCIVDRHGYPWIAYQKWNYTYTPASPNDNRSGFVSRSNLRNGSWNDASGFPYKIEDLSDLNSHAWRFSFHDLSTNMFCLWYRYSEDLRGRLWDYTSSSWEVERAGLLNSTYKPHRLNAASDSNDVTHILATPRGVDGETDVWYVNVTYGEFSNATVIATMSNEPAFRGETVCTNGPDVYLFWRNSSTVIAQMNYTSGVWGAAFDWKTTYSSNIYCGIQGFYNVMSEKFALSWVTGTLSSNYRLWFQSYTWAAMTDYPPTFSDLSYNSTLVVSTCLFTCKWTDDVGMSGFIFSWKTSSSWVNDSWVSFSGNPTIAWANVTKQLPNTLTPVYYRCYGNDTSNNWIVTPSTNSFTITGYSFTFNHRDMDNNNIDSIITWTLWNQSTPITYTEGEYTLPNETYTLQNSFRGHLINTTQLPTNTHGNTAVPLPLQVKRLGVTSRYVAFNDTITWLELHAATDSTTSFSATSNGTNVMLVVDVPRNCSYVQKGGTNQTDWTYYASPSNHVYLVSVSLSTWEFYHPLAGVVEALVFTPPVNLLQYLLSGDIAGFIVGTYTSLIGEAFPALIMLAIFGILYNRTGSLALCSIVWLLVGALMIGATSIVSPLAVVLVAVGLTGSMYKLFNKS